MKLTAFVKSVLACLLSVSLVTSLAFAQNTVVSVQNHVHAKMIEGGQAEVSAFEQLVQAYMDAYVEENPPVVDIYKVLVKTINENKSFTDAQIDIIMQQAESAAAKLDTPKAQLDANDKQYQPNKLTNAATALLKKMFEGTVSDFNHKIIILAGLVAFDPQSGPAVRTLFEIMNDMHFNSAHFSKLRQDEQVGNQALFGAAVAPAVVTGAALLAMLHPKNWGKLKQAGSTAKAFFKRSGTKAKYFGKNPVQVAKPNLSLKPAQSTAVLVDDLDDITRIENKAPLSTLTTEATRAFLAEAEILKREAANLDEAFESLGISGATERAAKAAGPAAQVAQKAGRFAAASKKTKELMGRLALVDYKKFLRLSLQSQLIRLGKILGIMATGAAVNVAYQQLIAAAPSDKNTRITPLDQEHDDLLTHHYNALAALNLTCRMHNIKVRAHNMLIGKTLTAEQIQSLSLETILTELAQVVSYHSFLDEKTLFRSKTLVDKEITFDDNKNTINLNKKFFNMEIKESFVCSKYDGLGSSPLEVSLNEVISDAGTAFTDISKLPRDILSLPQDKALNILKVEQGAE